MAVEIPVVVDIDKAFQDAARRVKQAIKPLEQEITDKGVLELKFRTTVAIDELNKFGNSVKVVSKDTKEGTAVIERSFEDLWANGKPKLDDLRSALASFKTSLNSKWNNGKMDSPDVESLQKAIILMEEYLNQRNRVVQLTEEQYRKTLMAARAEEERNFIINSEAKTMAEMSERISALRGRLQNVAPGGSEWKKTAREIVKATEALEAFNRKYAIITTKPGSINRITAEMQILEEKWNSMSKRQKFDPDGNLTKSAQKVVDKFRQLTNESEKFGRSLRDTAGVASKELDTTNSKLASLIKNSIRLIALHSATTFIRNVREVTAEFELQKVALGSIIQDTERASSLFRQIKAAAIESPFEIKDLVTYTKQLSAYQIETDKLFDTTMKLADVSAGLGVDMGRLILAYGQVRAASVLRGQELRQFTEAGIPLVEKLADKFSELNKRTVTTGEVFELISKRLVPFQMIDDIFTEMTSAGGMFYKMQEKQAETLQGQWNNMKDAISIMYDEIGRTKTVHSAMSEMIKDARWLMLHWRDVASVIKVAGSALLTYVAVVKTQVWWTKLVAAAETAAAAAESSREITLRGLTARIIGKSAAEKIARKATVLHTAAMKAADVAATSFGKTMWRLVAILAKNPFGIALIAVGALASKFMTLSNSADEVEQSVSSADRSIQELSRARGFDDLIEQYERLASKTDRTAKEEAALRDISRELAKVFPKATEKINEQTGALILNVEQMKKYSESAQELIKSGQEAMIKENENQIKALERRSSQIEKVKKQGYGFVGVSLYYNLDKDTKNTAKLTQEYIELNEQILQLKNTNNELRDSINGVKKETADTKVPYPPIPDDKSGDRLQRLRNEISDLNNAYKKYIELSKYEGKIAAKQDIGILFPSLKGMEPTYENMVKRLEDMLKQYNGDADATRIIEQAIANVKFDEIKRSFEEKLKELADKIKDSETARNFFNDILGLTGDKDIAANLTMSIYGDSSSNLEDQLKKQLTSAFTLDASKIAAKGLDAKAIKADVDKAIREGDFAGLAQYLDFVAGKSKDTAKSILQDRIRQNAEIAKSYAKLLMKYDEIEQQRVNITNQANQDIETLQKGLNLELKAIAERGGTEEEIARAKARNAAAQSAVNAERDLQLDRLTKEYRLFFSTIGIISNKSARDIAQKQKKMLTDQFVRGQISLSKYKREIKEINDQLEKYAKNRGMFSEYLKGGLDAAIEKMRQYSEDLVGFSSTIKLKDGVFAPTDEERKFLDKMDKVLNFGNFSKIFKKGPKLTLETQINQAALDARHKAQLEGKSAFEQEIEAEAAAAAASSDAADKIMQAAANFQAGFSQFEEIFYGVVNMIGYAEKQYEREKKAMGKDIVYSGNEPYPEERFFGWNRNFVSSFEKFKSGDVFGWFWDIGEAFSELINPTEKWHQLIDIQSVKIEKLEYQYGRIEKSIQESFGSDYIANYNKQLDILYAKQAAYEEQARLESEKGKKKDGDAIDNYKKQARAVADQIADMESQLSEFFSGTDITSAAKDFATAWIDAYKEFGSTTDAMKEKFQDMVQEMVTNSLAARVMQNLLDPIFKQIDELSQEGGELSAQDIATIAAAANAIIPNINDAMTTLMGTLNTAGYNIRQQAGQLTGIKRNIANATEESITGLAAGVNTQNFYMSYVPIISANVAAIVTYLTGDSTQTSGATPITPTNSELMMGHLDSLDRNLGAMLDLLRQVTTNRDGSFTNSKSLAIRMS